ncbi:MAG: hypothetical protein LBL66_00380 [Clostridiales bacterium]|jgi:uncharacterized metal-binding protein|nr:hypothetical protein [Clostridiales bacterium]
MREESARAFLCSVEIAASRFALIAMTKEAFVLLAMTGCNAVCTLPD